MKFLTISKILMILILPFLLFLTALNLYGFDEQFYEKKFTEYKVQNYVPQAISINEKVINFITGKNNEIPAEFNEREKQHLVDVRKTKTISTTALYIMIFLFIFLLIAAILTLKINNFITNFIGKILILGGVFTITLASVLFFP